MLVSWNNYRASGKVRGCNLALFGKNRTCLKQNRTFFQFFPCFSRCPVIIISGMFLVCSIIMNIASWFVVWAQKKIVHLMTYALKIISFLTLLFKTFANAWHNEMLFKITFTLYQNIQCKEAKLPSKCLTKQLINWRFWINILTAARNYWYFLKSKSVCKLINLLKILHIHNIRCGSIKGNN